MITLAPILIEEAESHLEGLQIAINLLCHVDADNPHCTPDDARIAVKRLQEVYWLIDNGIRDHERGNVIPFMRPVTTAVRQMNPDLWPSPAA